MDEFGNVWVMLVWITMGEAFSYVWIWLVVRPISQYCRVCSNVLIIFFKFCWLFLKTFYLFQLLGQIWEFFSNVGIFHYGWGVLVHLKMLDWKTHFSKLQVFWCFPVARTNLGFLINIGIFHCGWGFLVGLNLVGWKTSFSILQGFLKCFNN